MAAVKKGILTKAPEWWKHLRWTKRVFWKRERKAARDAGKRDAFVVFTEWASGTDRRNYRDL